MPKYRVVHNNVFSFENEVNHCLAEARLRPIENHHQTVSFGQYVSKPLISKKTHSIDGFGNTVSVFEIERTIQSFTLSAIHTVTTTRFETIDLNASRVWEDIAVLGKQESDLLGIYVKAADNSAYLSIDKDMETYARQSFTEGRPVLAAAYDLMERIYQDFAYDVNATGVNTPTQQSFALKRGVCQDFTHVAISCCLSLGVPARYVSGYVDTKRNKPQNQQRIAQDDSHAWFSVYDPDAGWVDFDPTNNRMIDDGYITVAYGRDYHDVAPLTGKVDSAGVNRLSVNVDISQID